MSRKHYITIAKSLNSVLNDPEWKYKTAKAVFDEIVVICADVLEGDNKNFDRDRFFTAVYNKG